MARIQAQLAFRNAAFRAGRASGGAGQVLGLPSPPSPLYCVATPLRTPHFFACPHPRHPGDRDDALLSDAAKALPALGQVLSLQHSLPPLIKAKVEDVGSNTVMQVRSVGRSRIG